MVGLLMAPERLPACFSFEDRDEVATGLSPMRRRPTLRLAAIAASVSRALAARAVASRNRSAAAW